MHHRNNQLAVCAGVLVAFVCALFVKWYTINSKRLADGSHWPDVEVTGIHGSLALPLDTPIWLLLVVSMFFTLLLAANILGWTSIPWWIVAVGAILPAVGYALPLFVAEKEVSVAVGPALAIFASLVVLGLVSVGVPARQSQMVLGSPATNLWK